MDIRHHHAPRGTFDAETVVPQAPHTAGAARGSAVRREIVHGSGPHLTTQTQSLLRLRLRAAALLLLFGFGAFLVRHIIGVVTGEPLDPWLLGFHIVIVLILGLLSLALSPRAPLSLPKLLIGELVIFGLPAIFFVALEHREILAGVSRGYIPGFM